MNFSFFYIEKYKVVAFFAYGFEEVLALDCFDESFYLGFRKGMIFYASHVVAYPVFHFTRIAVRIVCYGVHIYVTAES